jgi:pyruvate carboxylase subunit B
MKMEIEIIAPVAGIVSKILVNTTDSVEDGQTLAFIS